MKQQPNLSNLPLWCCNTGG